MLQSQAAAVSTEWDSFWNGVGELEPSSASLCKPKIGRNFTDIFIILLHYQKKYCFFLLLLSEEMTRKIWVVSWNLYDFFSISIWIAIHFFYVWMIRYGPIFAQMNWVNPFEYDGPFDQMNGPMDVEYPNRQSNNTLVCYLNSFSFFFFCYLNSSLIVAQVWNTRWDIEK